MDDRLKKAFDFACDSTKQLITLSTAIVTLTITFSKDVIASVSIGEKRLLIAAWLLYLVSVFCGVITLLNLTGNLEPKNKAHPLEPASIWAPGICRFSIGQVLTFLLGTALIITFGIVAVARSN